MNDDRKNQADELAVYAVRTEGDEEGKTSKFLGYARGKPELIRKYFTDKMYYTLYIDEVKLTILNITPELVDEKQKLLAEKTRLEERLKEISEGLEKRIEGTKKISAEQDYFSAPRTVTEMAWPMS